MVFAVKNKHASIENVLTGVHDCLDQSTLNIAQAQNITELKNYRDRQMQDFVIQQEKMTQGERAATGIAMRLYGAEQFLNGKKCGRIERGLIALFVATASIYGTHYYDTHHDAKPTVKTPQDRVQVR